MTTTPMRRPHRILRVRAVRERFSIARSTLYEYLNPNSDHYIPDFPKPVKFGGTVGFIESEIDEYFERLMHSR